MIAKRSAAVLLAAALGISITACGQKSASVSSSSAAAVSSASSAVSASSSGKEPKTSLMVALDNALPPSLLGGLYAAAEEGFFSQYHLEVALLEPAKTSDVLQQGATGSAQFLTVTQSGGMAAALSKKQPLTAVAALMQHSDDGVFVQESKSIVRPKQLEHQSCLTSSDPVLQAKLAQAVTDDGGDFSLLQTAAGTQNSMPAAVRDGSAAACGAYGWNGLQLKEANIPARVLFFRDVSPQLDDYPLLLAANNTFLQKRPKAAKDFLAAVKLGYLYAAAHPENTAQLICRRLPAVAGQKALIQRSLTWLAGKYSDDAAQWGRLDASRWNRFYNWFHSKKLTESAIPPNAGLTNQYLPISKTVS